jgi:hypothetical protein
VVLEKQLVVTPLGTPITRACYVGGDVARTKLTSGGFNFEQLEKKRLKQIELLARRCGQFKRARRKTRTFHQLGS